MLYSTHRTLALSLVAEQCFDMENWNTDMPLLIYVFINSFYNALCYTATSLRTTAA